jgi:hypothetical protein
MKETTRANVTANVQGILDEVDWDSATKDALVKLIDLAQSWVLPVVKKSSSQLGSLLEFALQAAEDWLRNKKSPGPAPQQPNPAKT